MPHLINNDLVDTLLAQRVLSILNSCFGKIIPNYIGPQQTPHYVSTVASALIPTQDLMTVAYFVSLVKEPILARLVSI
jgi:hypothetical protein